MPLLRLHEYQEWPRQEMALTVAYLPLEGLIPVPEEWHQAFQPLKPRQAWVLRQMALRPACTVAKPSWWDQIKSHWALYKALPLKDQSKETLPCPFCVTRTGQTIFPGLHPLVIHMLHFCQAKKPHSTCHRQWRSPSNWKSANVERSKSVDSHPSSGVGFNKPLTKAFGSRPNACKWRGPWAPGP